MSSPGHIPLILKLQYFDQIPWQFSCPGCCIPKTHYSFLIAIIVFHSSGEKKNLIHSPKKDRCIKTNFNEHVIFFLLRGIHTTLFIPLTSINTHVNDGKIAEKYRHVCEIKNVSCVTGQQYKNTDFCLKSGHAWACLYSEPDIELPFMTQHLNTRNAFGFCRCNVFTCSADDSSNTSRDGHMFSYSLR